MSGAPRLLFVIADSWGPLGCSIPVAHELRRRGAEVCFSVFDFHGFLNRSNEMFPPVDAEKILRAEGLPVLEAVVPHVDVPGRAPLPKNVLLEYKGFQSLFRDFLIPYYESWTLANLPRFAEFRPDAMWVKDQVLAGVLAAEKLAVPWGTYSVYTAFVEGADSLPWTMGFSPPRTAVGRTINQIMKWGMRRFRMTLDDAFNASRARLDLPPVEDALITCAVSPHLCTIFWPLELEPPRRSWPQQVHFVGPYSWDVPPGYAMPAWMADLPSDRPLIYSTIGTTSNRMEMNVLEIVIDALRDEPYDVAISTGDDYVRDRLPSAPSNFHIETFIPNTLILPHTSVLVQHGGCGTVMQCMLHGVPTLVMPGNNEHFDNAQRIVERGCGLRIDKKKLTPEKIRTAVRRLLSEPSFREAAQRMKGQLARYDAARSCADALMDLAQSGKDKQAARGGAARESAPRA